MSRIWFLAAALLLTACGTHARASDKLVTDVVAFDPDGFARGKFAALSTSPIDERAFASWYAGAQTDPRTDDGTPTAPGDGTTLLAVTGSTGCRTPESVQVRRVGADLRVTFAGGEDHEECFRPVGPTAIVALRTTDVRDVTTVNGERPVDPAGPGRLVDFVPLGTEKFDDVAATELTDTTAMAARLAAIPEALDALAKPVPAGHRGFAFVRGGCVEHGAVLLVNNDVLTAELTGDEHVGCAQEAFFLATFAIPEKYVPATAVVR